MCYIFQVIFSKAFKMKDYILKKKSLWNMFDGEKSNICKMELCIHHSKG